MEQRKICILGAAGVGKRKLLERCARPIFAEEYQALIGLQVWRKAVKSEDIDVSLMLWLLSPESEYERVRASYLRGASGYVLVADGLNASSLAAAMNLDGTVRSVVGDIPRLLILNKMDRIDDWEIREDAIQSARATGLEVVLASAFTGTGIDVAFQRIVELLRRDRSI